MYECRYCKKSFVKETSLVVHMCEPKRRFQEQDERGVQLGLHAYLKFYELTQGSAKLKTFADFVASPYYRALVKFGRYCMDVRVINPPRFVEWLLKNNKKIDYWCRDSVYSEYLLEYLRVESPMDAVQRAIEYSVRWSEETGNPPHDHARFGNDNALCYSVTTGRLSAWVLYNSNSGQEFLGRLSSEQIGMIWPYVDADFWQQKFRDYPTDVAYIKDILKQAGW